MQVTFLPSVLEGRKSAINCNRESETTPLESLRIMKSRYPFLETGNS